MRKASLALLFVLAACSSEPNEAEDAVRAAYTGFKPFFYMSGRVEFAGDDGFTELMNRCYPGSDDPDPDNRTSQLQQSLKP